MSPMPKTQMPVVPNASTDTRRIVTKGNRKIM